MITIVDYGMGNLRSVQKGLEKVGASARITAAPADVRSATKLILPGVGAFGDAMKHLCERGLVEPLIEFAASGRPFMGICLGQQLLFDTSYEEGEWKGLGIIPGKVIRFDFSQPGNPALLCNTGMPAAPGEPTRPRAGVSPTTAPPQETDPDPAAVAPAGPTLLKVPHMGWNQVRWERPSPMLAGLDSGTHFYFVHAYHVVPADDSVVLGTCHYGYPFTAVVERGNVFATQFHPEKSQTAGLTILRNFAAL